LFGINKFDVQGSAHRKVPDAVYTVLSSWWWAEEPPETCRAFHRNK